MTKPKQDLIASAADIICQSTSSAVGKPLLKGKQLVSEKRSFFLEKGAGKK